MGRTVAPIRRKLLAAQQLVQEQLAAGHIAPPSSLGIPPYLLSKRNLAVGDYCRTLCRLTNIWKLWDHYSQDCQDLWLSLRIITWWSHDLKACFFIILLHPEGSPKFVIGIPSINFRELHQRYEWVMLPRAWLIVQLCASCMFPES